VKHYNVIILMLPASAITTVTDSTNKLMVSPVFCYPKHNPKCKHTSS